MILRPYQETVVDELWEWFRRNQDADSHPVVEACVGAGKSIIIAEACKRAVIGWPGTKIIVVVHQAELLIQNLEKLQTLLPGVNIGIWSASLGKKHLADITIATIGSIYRHAADIANAIGSVAMIHADECHLIGSKEEGMWRTFISDMRRYSNPQLRVVGWTGTPFKGSGVWLTQGEKPLFTHITARVKIKQLLELGFLAPLVPAEAPQLIDASSVATSGGDYVVSDLERVVDDADVVRQACARTVELGENRAKWLVFCVTVKHAIHVTDELKRLGIKAELVTGDTPKAERDKMLKSFKAGEIRCMVNIGVLTTGFDAPEVDFIALLRPTKSLVLFVQMLGRGMRVVGRDIVESIGNGKENCLVADFTGTVKMLGPVDAITGRNKTGGGKKGVAPYKGCPECGSHCKPSDKDCPECGFVFPENEKHAGQDDTGALLSEQLEGAKPAFVNHKIDRVTYLPHVRLGKTPSVRIAYFEGARMVASDFLCVEHKGYARTQAETWWFRHIGPGTVPINVSGAINEIRAMKSQGRLTEPSSMDVDHTGKFPTITKRYYGNADATTRSDQAGHQRPDPHHGTVAGAAQAAAAVPEGDQPGLPKLRTLERWAVHQVQGQAPG